MFRAGPNAYSLGTWPQYILDSFSVEYSLDFGALRNVWDFVILQNRILSGADRLPLVRLCLNKTHIGYVIQDGRGSLLHLLRDCPAVKTLWLEVKSLNVRVFRNVACWLDQSPDNDVGVTVDWLWTLCCLSTKRLILLSWKKREPASFSKDAWPWGIAGLAEHGKRSQPVKRWIPIALEIKTCKATQSFSPSPFICLSLIIFWGL